MSVLETTKKPGPLAHFPDTGYRWLELRRRGELYGHAAIAGRGEDLEAHLTLARWGPDIRREMGKDMEWLKKEAIRMGKRRILGVRIDSQGEFSPGLFRFAALFGFTERCVLQTVAMKIQ